MSVVVILFFFTFKTVSLLSNRVESTDSLRGRIRELETECKKLSMDMKLKEEQIRDLEGKCQVRLTSTQLIF